VGRNLLGEFSAGDKFSLYKGGKRYELTNHLGNVLSVVSDELTPNGEAQVLSAKDYYPFGMSMPGRGTEGGTYRYGFNGKETDPETELNDFGARFYAANLGRWLSIDPLFQKYVSLSPYNGMGNNPIVLIDSDGREIIVSDKQGQEIFLMQMKLAFGAASIGKFTFDEKGKLSVNLDALKNDITSQNNKTKNAELQVATYLSNLAKDENIRAIIHFEKTLPSDIEIRDRNNNVVANNLDETGGEAVLWKLDANRLPTYKGDVPIYIDPAEYASFEVIEYVKKYKLQDGTWTRDEEHPKLAGNNGEPISIIQQISQKVSLSIYSRLFHALGHVTGKSDTGEAIDIENEAGAIHKRLEDKKGKETFKPYRINARNHDDQHPKKTKQ
jgi:RHS repeat-associated protein